MSPVSRTARIFISSTFRDFGEERDLLVRKVFPALRARLKDRFVELVDVDLRWGITAEQAERGQVLPICLAEIDRSRPFFVGLLGERYGWIPPSDTYPSHVLEAEPWLEAHRGGKSVTELEILHGVLNDPRMAGRALFYFRSAAYATKKGGDYVPSSQEDARRQSDLKRRIRASGFPVVEDYADPDALAERLESDLWAILDETFPPAEVPDAFARETLRHEAYAAPRRSLYLGGADYLATLDQALAAGQQWILIEGPSGGGKSALVANWVEGLARRHDDLVLHIHYLGATADASDPVSLARRLIEAVRKTTGSEEEPPQDPDELLEALPSWLARAGSWAGLQGRRLVLVIDALNGLTERRDLRWFPSFLPERVHLVVSSLPGEVLQHLQAKADWQRIQVRPLDRKQAEELFVAYLRQFNKALPQDLLSEAMGHELMANPLFLRTLAEELRLFGEHERLGERLQHYLTSRTVDDLFERVLARVEEDNGADAVRRVMLGLWASRAGLTEEEVRAYADLKPAEWAYIRNALGHALLEGSGRIVFGHDYLRIAVSDRYLAGNNTLEERGQSPEALRLRRQAHSDLARWFEGQAFRGEGGLVSDARAAEEIPHQWRAAKDWDRLKASITKREMFETLYANRTNEELLACWLDLEREANADIESNYEAAWAKWGLNDTAIETGNLASCLARFLSFAGRHGDFSLRLARLALAIPEKVLGPENPDTATSLNNLAYLLNERGDYAGAEPLYRRALAIREKVLGPEHPDTAISINNLAGLLEESKDDYAGSEALYRRALAIAEKVEGPEHPSTVISLSNVAGVLETKGDYAEAELLYRRALAICERKLGAEDLLTGGVLGNLSALLSAKGDKAGAELLVRRALAIREKALGPEHPAIATSLGNLAGILQAKGDDYGAEPLYRRALAIWERALGPEHPDTATCLNNLATLVVGRGDDAGAEPLYRRALAIREKALGPDHSATGNSLNNLAGLLRDRGDYAGAEPLYRRALAIWERALGPEHPDTATCLNNLATLVDSRGDDAGAEPLYRRALAIREGTLGPEDPDTATSLNNLAGLLRDRGDHFGAEPLYRRAFAIREKVLGIEHPDTTRSLYSFGQALKEAGRLEEAEKCFMRELEIISSLPVKNSMSIAQSRRNFGTMLREMGRLDEAADLLERALMDFEAMGEDAALEMTATLSALGQTLALKGELRRAEALLTRCLDIRRARLPADDDRIALAQRRLDDLRGKLRDEGEGR